MGAETISVFNMNIPRTRKAKPTPADIEAGKRLRAEWDKHAFALGLTQEKMADILGGTQGLVSQYLTQRIPLNYRSLLLFSKALNIAPEVIRTDLPEQKLVQPSTNTEDMWADVRSYTQRMGLGTTGPEIAEDVDTHILKFRKDSLHKRHLNYENLVIMHGTGDSMLPDIQSRDAIMFDTSDTTPHDRHIYVIITPGAAADEYNVKRCIIDNKKQVFFAADNPLGDHDWKSPRWKDDPNYPIKIIGRVRWVGRWL
ncbi:LexA family transcriptional regulator [Xylella fastidiosa]|uniref:XRE family transcriptional regulator n=1 Tax=Xylella fastidiosa subsp. multiplex TaxID=644357 RepID=A0AAW6HVS0_XYLFS|nr:XRE family transcriptional regulator [Xylella fastidiosa]MBS9446367.1 helix-turn-helix transcriptional regulator [Xylella fastidiosa subsp. multiplex]MBS9448382.1 helix-turn-helix transcriptional regulator [Xylella fastidiosa subsp. multiplex]MBS9450404.1 helix-turn-helix transcriptional regulator [Xylella fastidiosa subsp. multiplex]MBS9452190.1 helix-turn-helix transcriptional regulator [Xylella fastidiosa subsp. multiplex]MBS9486744.1 helix-turn-helix transcriptional regulator [Xylella f